MDKVIHAIEKIVKELQEANHRLSSEVKEGGSQALDGFDKLMAANEKMKTLLFVELPERLSHMAKQLRSKNEK